MYPVSPAFLTAVAGSHEMVNRVEVWQQPGGGVGEPERIALLGTVSAGSVNIDETRQVRRTCTLTINSEGLSYDDLVPVKAGDLLHPATGNELRVYRGVRFPNGTEELAPLGVFRMTQPTVTDDISGDGITIQVQGNDRSAWISRIKWQAPWVIAPEADLGQAVHGLIDSRVRGLSYDFASTGSLGPIGQHITFGTDLAGSNDPWADAVSLAALGGMELFFNETGTVVMRPVILPAAVPVAASFTEGDNCTMSEVHRNFDETLTYNGVIVIANGGPGAPVQAAVWDTNPASPTYVNGPWGRTPLIIETALISTDLLSGAKSAALRMANAQFQMIRRAFDAVDLTAAPNPSLTEGDGISVIRERVGIEAKYVTSAITMPMDPESPMVVTTRPQEAAA
jgi:hypothetical protein